MTNAELCNLLSEAKTAIEEAIPVLVTCRVMPPERWGELIGRIETATAQHPTSVACPKCAEMMAELQHAGGLLAEYLRRSRAARAILERGEAPC